MAQKTVKFNKSGISKLPIDKPATYEILSDAGGKNYTGIAKRGRLQERLQEHLPGAKHPIPGSKVRVEQHSSVDNARKSEMQKIERDKPKYNTHGK
jgi:hypothetical protein